MDESNLSKEDRSNPAIKMLLGINRQQAEINHQLKDEIDRLKKHSNNLDIKPSSLEKKKKVKSKKGKRTALENLKKPKISGSTRNESGWRAGDTFTGLKKTYRKLSVSFWQYIKDRIENIGSYPALSSIEEQALKSG